MRIPKELSVGEECLAIHLRANGIPYDREVRFDSNRKFKFDFVIGEKLAVEIDGGNFTGGHSRGNAYVEFCRKINLATALGWRVYRFTTAMVESGEAIDTIQRVLGR